MFWIEFLYTNSLYFSVYYGANLSGNIRILWIKFQYTNGLYISVQGGT